jgi:hypothetical protein
VGVREVVGVRIATGEHDAQTDTGREDKTESGHHPEPTRIAAGARRFCGDVCRSPERIFSAESISRFAHHQL